MSNSYVVIGCQSIGKTALMYAIIERLREKGCDVIVVDSADIEKYEYSKQIDITFDEYPKIEQALKILAVDEYVNVKPIAEFEYKRERDYPTLREGIRRNKIRSFRK